MNLEFLYVLENIRNVFLNYVFLFFTSFAEEIVIILLFSLIFWCLDKKLGYKVLFAYFLSGLAVQGLKLTFRIERPWILDPNFKPVDQALGSATGYSFPSGHTQCATSLYGSIAFHLRKKIGYIISFVIIGLVMFSRMYLGCHTPKDVLVSFGITLIFVLIIEALASNISMTKAFDVVIVIALEIAAALLTFYFVKLVNSGASTAELAMDGFKSTGAVMGFAIAWFIEKYYVCFTPKTYSKKYQVIKMVVGLLVVLILKVGRKALLGDNIPGNMIRYAILVLWIVAVFPFMIKKFINDNNL